MKENVCMNKLFSYVYFQFFFFKLAASKSLGVPLTIYCQSNIDPGKKEFLLHEGANLVLHGNDCVEAELKARSDAQVYVCLFVCLFVCFMVFNTTFNNISLISWRSVLSVEGPENTTDLSQITDKLYHIMLYTLPLSRFKLTTSVVICTDCYR